jgi:hypothetical protein
VSVCARHIHSGCVAFLSAMCAQPLAFGVALLVAAAPATAQPAVQANMGVATDDPPSVKVGATLFTDYTVQQRPKVVDGDGNQVTFNQFNVGRTYINVTGTLSDRLAFRITPDIVRETGPGSSLNGSYTFRLKYAYAQLNLGGSRNRSWVRLGMQQTPWIDFIEGIYRYRFQGTVFEEREGLLGSSDAGASFAYTLPGEYGDVHTGYYNGEHFARTEVNDQKAFETRATLRPLPGHPALRGLRLTVFHDRDAYVKDAERRRTVAAATFEHPHLHAAVQYFAAGDRTSASGPRVQSRGYSVWATPRATSGWEGLLRYDHLEPDRAAQGVKTRVVAGAAYWFPHRGPVAAALLLDVDAVQFRGFPVARPAERRIGLHALVNF